MTRVRNIFILIPFIIALSGCASQQKLMDSVKDREFDVTQDMVDAGMNPYVENQQGVSPFEAALESEKGTSTRAWAEKLLEESIEKAQSLDTKIIAAEITPNELARELEKKNFYIDAPLGKNTASLLSKLASTTSDFDTTDHAIVLIDAGADVESQVNDDAVDFRRNPTPLMSAASLGNIRLIKSLLDSGASISAKDKYDQTALHYAISGKSESPVSVVRTLVKRGASLDPLSRYGDSPLKLAAQKRGMTNVVNALLELGASADPITGEADSPLKAAIYKHQFESAKLLLEHGASPDGPIGEDEDSILLQISKFVEWDVLTQSDAIMASKLLLGGGAIIDKANVDGYTALAFSSASRQMKLTEYLISNGADIDHRDTLGRTPLFYATALNTSENFEAARLLLSYGSDIDVQDDYGRTSLYSAIDADNDHAVSFLLEAGASPDIATNANNEYEAARTPLMNAVYQGNSAVVAQLIEAGADHSLKDGWGWTALMLTANTPENGVRENDAVIAKLLIDAGSNVDAFNDDLQTPLF